MVRCVFFGTPPIAASVLEALCKSSLEIVGIVTQPDKPKGRGGKVATSAVKQFVESACPNIPLFQPKRASEPEFVEKVAALKPDLLVVVAYGQIMRQNLLDVPAISSINLHTSLLPAYRGAAPIQRCLINGDEKTGVSVMHMVLALDAGDVICQEEVEIDPNMNAGQLEEKLAEVGAKLLTATLPQFSQGYVPGVPQDEAKVSLAPKLELEDCQLDWSRAATQLHNLVRGSNPKPGAWCWVWVRGQQKRLKILKTTLRPAEGLAPGKIQTYGKQGLVVACAEGALSLETVQLEGKKPVESKAFCAGFSLSDVAFVTSDTKTPGS